MNHTFLFEPGRWNGTGTFWSEDGRAMRAGASTEVLHEADCWLMAGSLRVLSSPPVEFVSVYRISPPGKDHMTMKWTSENPTLGRLHGIICVAGPSILSVYRSETDGYQGVEHLSRRNEQQYDACGALLMGDRRISSWCVELTRDLAGLTQ